MLTWAKPVDYNSCLREKGTFKDDQGTCYIQPDQRRSLNPCQ